MATDSAELICDTCHFPKNALIHTASIAGEAGCENPIFRPLRHGEIPRTLSWKEHIGIASVLLAGAVFIVFLAWIS